MPTPSERVKQMGVGAIECFGHADYDAVQAAVKALPTRRYQAHYLFKEWQVIRLK